MKKDIKKVMINGYSLILEPVENERKTKSGLIIAGTKATMYETGRIVSLGNDMSNLPEVESGDVAVGTLVMYNKNRVTDIDLELDGEIKTYKMAEDYKAAVKVIL